jgi:Leucine-rich repeat (LRR) protein
LAQLQTLSLAHNRLTGVEGLVGLRALVELDLAGNHIGSAQCLRGLSLNTRLRVLRLEGMCIIAVCWLSLDCTVI